MVFDGGVVVLEGVQNSVVSLEAGEAEAKDLEDAWSFFRRYVPSVEGIVKFLFGLQVTSRSTVVTVLTNKGMYRDAILMALMVHAQIFGEMLFPNANTKLNMLEVPGFPEEQDRKTMGESMRLGGNLIRLNQNWITSLRS